MIRHCAALALAAVAVSGCTTIRETQPAQTAREQLIMTSAADYAAAQVKPNLPAGNTIYIDASHYTKDSAYHTEYLITALDAQLLAEGYRLVDSPKQADTIAMVGNGGMSIEQSDTLVGVPSIPLPIPLTGTVQTPKIALYDKDRHTGVSKMLVAFYSAKTGTLQDIAGPIYGFSHYNVSSLFGYSWRKQNILPPSEVDQFDGKIPKPMPSVAPVENGAAQSQSSVTSQ